MAEHKSKTARNQSWRKHMTNMSDEQFGVLINIMGVSTAPILFIFVIVLSLVMN